MKALHKLTAHKEKPFSKYAQIKNREVFVSNGIILCQIPVGELFGEDFEGIEPDEVLYFSLQQWGSSKLDKATKIIRDGNFLKGTDKNGNSLGVVELSVEISEKGEVLTFPDYENFTLDPDAEVIAAFGIRFEAIEMLKNVTGYDRFIFERIAECDTGYRVISIDNKRGKVLDLQTRFEGSTINPQNESFKIYKVPASSDFDEELQIKSDEISELRTRLAGVTTAETGLGDLVYKADNLALAELMDDFIELVRGGNAKEIMETMKIL